MKYFLMLSAMVIGLSNSADAACFRNRPVVSAARVTVVNGARAIKRAGQVGKNSVVRVGKGVKRVVQSRPGIILPKL